MDQQLTRIMGQLFSFVFRQTLIELVKTEEQRGEDYLSASFTPQDYTRQSLANYRLGVTLKVKGGVLHYTLTANGAKFIKALPQIKHWLNHQKISGEKSCAQN